MHIGAPPAYTPTELAQPATPVTPELAVALVADSTTHDVLISIVPPTEPLSESQSSPCKRAPVDICCVIDVSGSMNSELKASLEEGKAAELTGLSTLDVVKHAVKTIVATMQSDDRISIVTFSNAAKVIVGLTPMTATGKAEVLQAVRDLRVMASTNLWDGLKTGMNILNNLASVPTSHVLSQVSSARLSTLFLLTDGMPNINPPRGLIKMLISYLDSHPLRFSIHTFGFGYTLDSQLLLQIARHGHGVYGFIPDASALGAVFIHAVANLYSTCAHHVELSVEYSAAGSMGDVGELSILDGPEDATSYGWGTKIEVGAVQYGQTRDFIFSMKNYPQPVDSLSDPALSVTVRYSPWTHSPGDKPLTCTVPLPREAIANEVSGEDYVKLTYHSHRFTFLRAVDYLFKPASPASADPARNSRSAYIQEPTSASLEFSDLLRTAIPKFKVILSALQTPPLSADASTSALAGDIAGEVLLALSSSDIYSRWGQHYLASLARWHLLQQCGSYRDPGLQAYGAASPLFVNSRDALDQAFDSLPPPEPSINHRSTYPSTSRVVHTQGAAGGIRPRQELPSMSAAFAARRGPCFDGACEIALADGHKIPVRDLRRGVRIQTPKGARKVVAVLETHMPGSEALLCELPGGLRITPWHPIKIFSSANGRWVFPATQSSPELQACNAVYSLLLEPDADPDAHSVYIQDVLCVTLGHGVTRDVRGEDVRAHAFLGDYEHILRSLALFPDAGAEEGVFCIGGVVKHAVSGMISGFLPCDGTRSDTSADAPVRSVVAVA